MVRILVKLNTALRDFAIIELQGSLESDGMTTLAGEKIGDLFYDEKGIPNIVIGHHVLNGRVVTLEKPFAVLQKQTENSEDGCPAETETNGKYDIVSFVTKKIVFKNRPRPIITNTVCIKR